VLLQIGPYCVQLCLVLFTRVVPTLSVAHFDCSAHEAHDLGRVIFDLNDQAEALARHRLWLMELSVPESEREEGSKLQARAEARERPHHQRAGQREQRTVHVTWERAAPPLERLRQERVVQALNRLPDQQYRRPTDVSKAFGELTRNYLQHASYPANRDDLVATARDQGALIRSYTKWDDQPASVEAAAEALLRAHRIATTAPCGPVYVCLDVGLQESRIGELPPLPAASRFRAPAPAAPDPAALKDAAARLQEAQRPLILAGRVGRGEAAWRQRIALAEALGAIVLTDPKCGAGFPSRHELHGPPGGASRLKYSTDSFHRPPRSLV